MQLRMGWPILLALAAISARTCWPAETISAAPEDMRLAVHLKAASATLAADAAAPGGQAVRQPGGNTQWSVQWPVPFDRIDRGRRYWLRLLMRADRKGDKGTALNAGVYRPADKSYPCRRRHFDVAQVPTDAYEWLTVGEYLPGETDFVYLAPTANIANVAALYTAAIELVPVTAPAAKPGENRWVNALKPRTGLSAPLTLAQDGTTQYVIVVPEAPTPQEQKAADELAVWLSDTTGARFAVVSDREAPRAREISVGRTGRLAADLAVAQRDLGDEGYAIAVQGEKIFLIGGSERGPIYAALALLEEDLGCRWYTRKTSRVVRRPTLKLGIATRSYVPVFALRDPFYRDAFDATWSLMNRTNAPSARVSEKWGGHVNYTPRWFVHTYRHLVSEKDYFAEHPEYFQLGENGKRTYRNLCPTHPDVVRLGTDAVLQALEEHPGAELISVSKNDIRGVCQCPTCKALNEAEESNAAGPLSLVNKIAEAVREKHPDVIVTTLAYHDTVKPPQTMKPGPNVAIRLCTDSCMWPHPFRPAVETESFRQALEGWAAIHDKIHIWDYSVGFGDYMRPWPSFHAIAENLRSYAASNVTAVMVQGAYQSPGNERELMRCWVFAKLLWDPSREVWPLMQDFIRGYYGRAAPAIEEYNDLLFRSGLEHKDAVKAPDFLERANAMFDRAEGLADTDEVRRRVQLARLPVTSVELNSLQKDLAAHPEKVDRNEILAKLDAFMAVARREQISKVAERRTLEVWEERLRKFASDPDPAHLRNARVGAHEVILYRLSAKWRFARDLEDVGREQRWFAPGFEDDQWTQYRSDLGVGWEEQGSEGNGLGWFRQTIPVPAELKHKHLALYFRAVDESAWVYIDGELLHENTPETTGLEVQKLWIAPFKVDVRDVLKPGAKHQLAVRVHDCGGMGGIYMPVFLVGSDVPLTADEVTELVKLKNPWL